MGLKTFLDGFEQRDWQSETDGRVRFAVIGLGWWTVEQAIPATIEVENCETKVAISGSKEKAERISSEFEPIEHAITYDEFHAGEAEDAYDAVYICSPNALHLPYAETAASLGKAVLCEKPMEVSVDRARAMRDVCRENDVPLMIGYRMHTEPAIRRARELVRDGVIGKPTFVLGNNSQSLLSMFGNLDHWRLDPELVGPGASVTDIGIYPLNTARFLLDSDPVAAQAFMSSKHDAFGSVPDEHAAFTLSFDDGSYVSCTASQNAHTTTSLRVVGTEGEVYIEPAFHWESELRITRKQNTVDLSTPRTNQMAELFAYFADRVLSGANIGPDGQHGLLDVKAIRAVYDAAEQNRTISIG